MWDSDPGIPTGVLKFLNGYQDVDKNRRELWFIGVLTTFLLKMNRSHRIQLNRAIEAEFDLTPNEMVITVLLTQVKI